MTDLLLTIIIFIGIALIFIIYIEANEYRKYVKSSNALTALGEAMNIAFEQMGTQVGGMSVVQRALTMDAEEKDARIRILELVQSAHTEALSVKLLAEIAKSLEEQGSKDVTAL